MAMKNEPTPSVAWADTLKTWGNTVSTVVEWVGLAAIVALMAQCSSGKIW
ncbi:hypothetical protein [Pseudoroseomonas cervicalis]|nr:hypothetical protein [Pseudoroseomonas cervicalis]MDQ1077964.1 hypothetical protein [Pseudoroseomonas cervicalis]